MWTHAEFLAPVRPIFPSVLILVLALLAMHSLVVTRQIVYAVKRKKRSASGTQSPPTSVLCTSTPMDQVLSNPILSAKFRKFMVSEFAIENLLFYEACIELKALCLAGCSRCVRHNTQEQEHIDAAFSDSIDHSRCSSGGDTLWDMINVFSQDPETTSEIYSECFASNCTCNVNKQVMVIYHKFIKQNSLYEVNISGAIRATVEERVSLGDLFCGVFDAALAEISHLLLSWSLPRFIKQLNQSIEFHSSLEMISTK
jgi:hypothetical protein